MGGGHAATNDSGTTTLHGSAADIAYGKNARTAGFQRSWGAREVLPGCSIDDRTEFVCTTPSPREF